MIKGIDVSKWQRDIDFNKVKADGIDFVIIRAGTGKSTEDPYFSKNIRGAIDAGLKVGVYWFIYAKTSNDIIVNAKMCDAVLRNYKDSITLGVWADFEYDSDKYCARQLSVKERTAWVKLFLDTLYAKGYKVGVYANKDYKDNKFGNLSQYSLWFARYTDDESKVQNYNPFMWQFTDKGKVNGIKGNVDMNYLMTVVSGTKDYVGTVTTNGSNLMLRNEPNTKGQILKKIPNGSEVKIIARPTEGWLFVEFEGVQGYCFGKYVKE